MAKYIWTFHPELWTGKGWKSSLDISPFYVFQNENSLGSAYFKNVQTPLNVDLILKSKVSHLHPVHKLKKKNVQDPLSNYFLHLKVFKELTNFHES